MPKQIANEYKYLVVVLVKRDSRGYSPTRMTWQNQLVIPQSTPEGARDTAQSILEMWADRVLIFEADLDDDGNKIWTMFDELEK